MRQLAEEVPWGLTKLRFGKSFSLILMLSIHSAYMLPKMAWVLHLNLIMGRKIPEVAKLVN